MKGLLLFIIFSLTMSVSAQLLVEDFNYSASDLLTAHGWTAHSGGGTNPILVSSPGLSYSGYLGSGIGNAAAVSNNGEDDNKSFSAQTSGTVYYSFLVNVAAIPTAGYFIHFKDATATAFCGRVWIQNSSGNLQFGLSNSSTATYASTNFSFNTTYLVVVKSVVGTSGASSLWVFSSGVPSTESAAGTPLLTTTGASGLASISSISLRQFNTSQRITVDGIRVGTTWTDAPLPIELNSFSVQAGKFGVVLKWSTVTELNSYGFEVQRQKNDNNWQKVGFVVGAGHSNAVKQYQFIDKNITSGQYLYRLKQIDNDGAYDVSQSLLTNFSVSDYALGNNYPNPFNPTTSIDYQIPEAGRVVIKVFTLLGTEVEQLVDEVKDPGLYCVAFNARKYPSGAYIYQLQAGNNLIVKKMTILK